MLIDIIHDNPGEPPLKSRYRNPEVLKALGYDAVAIPNALPAVPLVQHGPAAGVPAPYNSLAELESAVDRRVAAARAAGLQVFFYVDAYQLPRWLVQNEPHKFLCADGSGRLCCAKPAVAETYEALIADLFARWPEAAGVILRATESAPVPHMLTTALQEGACPVCQGMSLVERLRGLIRRMHDLVGVRLGKIYVHRTFQRSLAGATLHDDPEIYRQVTADLPESDKLVFSFQFTRAGRPEGPWNPCISVDNRPKWIEFPCQRDTLGKGAFPNFQAPLWAQFLQESQLVVPNPAAVARAPSPESPAPFLRFPEPPPPLALVKTGISFWSFSRGSGDPASASGGPYLQREEWVDANVYALARLYRDPGLATRQIAREWASGTFGIEGSSGAADVLTDWLLRSSSLLRQIVGLGDTAWIRDDLLDVEGIWATAARLLEPPAADAACYEKLAALDALEYMRRLFEHVVGDLPNPAQGQAIANNLVYYNSFAGALAHLFCGFVRYFQWERGDRGPGVVRQEAADHLKQAQARWLQHTQRHALLPGVPSLFQESTFWERSNTCLEALAEQGT